MLAESVNLITDLVAPVAGTRVAQPEVRFSGITTAVGSDLDALQSEWRTFEQTADCTPFQIFDWLSTWDRCVGQPAKIRPAIVIGRKPSGELLFILPLAVDRSRFCRWLTFFGHALCDYSAPLLAPDFAEFVPEPQRRDWFAACCALLQQTPGCRHDAVLLDKMPETIGAQANPLLAIGTLPHWAGAHLTSLPSDWEAFYEMRSSSKSRRRDRARRRQLEEVGPVKFSIPTERADLHSALNSLFEQKSRSLARLGASDLFSRLGYREFFLTVSASEYAFVSRLDVGPERAAANLRLIFRGHYCHVLTTYDEDLSRFGPGSMHLREIISYGISKRWQTFDFTIGDEPFKLEWSDTEHTLHNHIGDATIAGFPHVLLVSLMQRAKRFIKSSPYLWAKATQLRVLLGRLSHQ